MFLQTDDFPEKVQKGCVSERTCEALLIEARARVTKCQPNTVGYIRCDDAHADEQTIAAKLAIYRRDRQEAAQDAQIAEGTARQKRAVALRQEAEEARAEKEAERQKQVERDVQEQAKRVAILAWQMNGAAKCRRSWIEVCENAPDDAVAKDIETCLSGCREAIESARTQALSRAEDACVAALSPGTRPKCEVAEPDGAPPIPPSDKALCASQCATRGKAEAARRAQAAADERAASAAAAAARAPRPAPGGSDHVKCCDGTFSPTCVTVHRGCCSHHGGVCG